MPVYPYPYTNQIGQQLTQELNAAGISPVFVSRDGGTLRIAVPEGTPEVQVAAVVLAHVPQVQKSRPPGRGHLRRPRCGHHHARAGAHAAPCARRRSWLPASGGC